jgi:hypothetical protein
VTLPGFDSRQRQEIFLCSVVSRPVLGATQPPIQWVLWALSPEVKRLGHESNHSPPSSAEVKSGGAIPASESYLTTDGQSASLSWNKAPIWGLRPYFYYRRTVAGLLMWGALSLSLSHFVASYDSQGHGGGIRPRLHRGMGAIPPLPHTYLWLGA